MDENSQSTVVLPLTWNGSTLAIPRASSTQDGYLSQETFVLFSGGTVVPVTSFNTRTGEVVLLEDDVLAALGYVPLNRQGDTMTGPLQLAGPPSSALHAATKAYVDALDPGTYRASDFKASGSAAKFSGSISAGTTNLTLTALSDFAIGQGIYIAAAGPSGGPLITKVTNISGLAITLQNPATAAVTAVANNVQHDDTVAIQTAMNTAAAAPGGGNVLFGPGLYRVNGPLTNINSILKIPFNAVHNPSASLGLIGSVAPGFMTYDGPTGPGGAIIQTDRIGVNADSSIIAAQIFNPAIDHTVINNTCLRIKGLTFRTYNNPQISAVDLGMVGFHLYIEDVCIDAGAPLSFGGGSEAVEPTHGTFGMRLPRSNVVTQGSATNVEVNNYGIGLIASEVMVLNNVALLRCKTGLRCIGAYHLLSGRLLLWQCPTFIEFIGPSNPPGQPPCNIDFVIDIERAGGGFWYSPSVGRDFYDPTNAAYGRIEYLLDRTDTGTSDTASVTGMTNVTLVNLGVP